MGKRRRGHRAGLRPAPTRGPVEMNAEAEGGNGRRTRRIQPVDTGYLRALCGTLGEWASAEDEEAYRGL